MIASIMAIWFTARSWGCVCTSPATCLCKDERSPRPRSKPEIYRLKAEGAASVVMLVTKPQARTIIKNSGAIRGTLCPFWSTQRRNYGAIQLIATSLAWVRGLYKTNENTRNIYVFRINHSFIKNLIARHNYFLHRVKKKKTCKY